MCRSATSRSSHPYGPPRRGASGFFATMTWIFRVTWIFVWALLAWVVAMSCWVRVFRAFAGEEVAAPVIADLYWSLLIGSAVLTAVLLAIAQQSSVFKKQNLPWLVHAAWG